MSALNEDVDLVLDEVIRDTNSRKAAEERKDLKDNTPLDKSYPNSQGKKRPFRTLFKPKSFNDRSSDYIIQMAKKRVQQAPRMLDPRQTVIAGIANNNALKLRWKLVAKTIFHLRKHAKNAPTGPARFHHYHATNSQGPSSELAYTSNGTVSHPRVSQSTLRQIERMVGKLPPWMNPTTTPTAPELPMGPLTHYEQCLISGVGPGPIKKNSNPLNPRPYGNVGVLVCQHPRAAQTHVHMPPDTQTQSPPSMGNHYFASQRHLNGMPPQVDDPVPPVTPIQKYPGSTIADQIEIIVVNEGSDIPPVKKTLNEHFTFRD